MNWLNVVPTASSFTFAHCIHWPERQSRDAAKLSPEILRYPSEIRHARGYRSQTSGQDEGDAATAQPSGHMDDRRLQ